MTTISNLPQDLLLSILSRLPVKTLLQLTSVCKNWLSLIKSPNFIKTHLNHTSKNPKTQSFIAHTFQPLHFPNHITYLLHLESLHNPINLHHPFPKSSGPLELEIVGSCNGLVCLTNHLYHICVWNPATKRVKNISGFTIRVLDPTGEVSLGFGFDYLSNDYKVVRIVWPSRSVKCKGLVEVYSINVGSWKRIEGDLGFELMQGSCRSIVKGNPYWVGLKDRWEHRGTFFVSFDICNELFRIFSWPDIDVVEKFRGFYSMVEYKESFAIIAFDRDEEMKLKVCLWEMEDEGKSSSWIKKFSFGLVSGMDRFVGCLKNGEIVAEKSNGRELFVYDPMSEEIKKTQVQMRTFGVYNYVESLVELK